MEKTFKEGQVTWEDVFKNDVKAFGVSSNWMILTMNKVNWKIGCERGVSSDRKNPNNELDIN